jgi:hypothetical protein
VRVSKSKAQQNYRTQFCDCRGCFAAGALGICIGIFAVSEYAPSSQLMCAAWQWSLRLLSTIM